MSLNLKIINKSELLENNNVCNFFYNKYNKNPDWIIQCPGRVNLIGEHIDYSNYSVFPMALSVNLILAVGKSCDQKIHFENVDQNKFESNSFEIKKLLFDYNLKSLPKWFNYFIAGWQGALESIFGTSKNSLTLKDVKKIFGLNVAVTSNIPPNAGLSSSSALVCAATLSTLAIQLGKEGLKNYNKINIATISTQAERFVGVEGGGMDQACQCLATANYALRIDFNPLNYKLVKLPENLFFVVMHSGVEINKAITSQYNQRVIECKLAAQIMCKKAGFIHFLKIKDFQSLNTLQEAAKVFSLDKNDPIEMINIVKKYLKLVNEPYSTAEICEILEINNNDFNSFLINLNITNVQEFWLTKRALHVYSEASRVLEFERICNLTVNNFTNQDLNIAEKLAELMNKSHDSCRNLFECSTLELDSTVEKSKKAGCLAARLTGAGWGGCVVALVSAKDYNKINEKKDELNILFWSKPSDGIKAYFS